MSTQKIITLTGLAFAVFTFNFQLHAQHNEEIERCHIGISHNISGGANYYPQRFITANHELGVMMATFRPYPELYPGANNNTIVNHIASFENPCDWSNYFLTVYADTTPVRRVSGSIFNPPQNTALENGIAVIACNYLNGNFINMPLFATINLDGNNLNVFLPQYNKDFGSFFGDPWVTRTEAGEGYYHNASYRYGRSSTSLDTFYLVPLMSQWDGNNSFNNWQYQDIQVNLAENWELDGGIILPYVSQTGMAFNHNGSVGYIWVLGVHNDIQNSYQPIVYKTTDQGITWEYIETFFENNPLMSQYLIPTTSGNVWPLFTEGDGVVDEEGNLQYFGLCKSAQYGSIDSLGYWWITDSAYQHIFKFQINDNGVDQVTYIDSVLTEFVHPDGSNSFGTGANAVGWNHELAATCEFGGTENYGLVWTDTEVPSFDENARPNIKVWSSISEGVTNFTSQTPYEGYYFFINVSEVSSFMIENDNELSIQIPVTGTVSLEEYFANNSLNPVSHYFTNNIFIQNGLTGIYENRDNVSEILIQFQSSNPVSELLSFSVSAQLKGLVQIEIYSIIGEKIITFSDWKPQKEHDIQFSVNTNPLTAGVYLIRAQSGNHTSIKKFVKQ